MLELRIDIARVHHVTLAHELKHRLSLRPALLRPHRAWHAGMHQVVRGARQEAVVDEVVFFDGQPAVAALQVTRVVALHAVAQRQVLRTRRCADRVGLHEAKPGDRAWQRGGGEK